MSAVRPSSDVEIKGLVEDWAPVSGTFSSRKLLSFRETEACDARYVTIAGICTAQLGKLSTDEADDMSQTHLIWRRVRTGALSSAERTARPRNSRSGLPEGLAEGLAAGQHMSPKGGTRSNSGEPGPPGDRTPG